jgi:hypothetical protein
MQRPRGQDVLQVRGERTIDYALRADRINGGTDDAIEIRLETGERNGQWVLQGSDQPERPVTTSNSRSSFATS